MIMTLRADVKITFYLLPVNNFPACLTLDPLLIKSLHIKNDSAPLGVIRKYADKEFVLLLYAKGLNIEVSYGLIK